MGYSTPVFNIEEFGGTYWGIVHLFLTLKSLVVTIGYSTPVFNIEEFGGHNWV